MQENAQQALIPFEVHQVAITTFQIGFEPGQFLTVTTTLPLLNEVLMIEQVDSNLQGPFKDQSPFIAGSGPIRFQHTLKASNTDMHSRQAGYQVFDNMQRALLPPIDRNSYSPSWTVAESIPGFTNPGVATTDVFAPIAALRPGIVGWVTVSFATPPATTDLIFDILLGGTSIFPAVPGGITYPVGTVGPVLTYTFANNPEPVAGPTKAGTGTVDEFTIVVLQGDAAAADGLIAITVYG